MDELYPIPDAEGIAKTREIYLNRFGKTLTDEQAAEVLGRVMRFLFFVAELTAPDFPIPADPASESARPGTSRRPREGHPRRDLIYSPPSS